MLRNSKESILKAKQQKSSKVTQNGSFIKFQQQITKKISGSIPLQSFPKTIYINSNELINKPKNQIQVTKAGTNQTNSQNHSRKISMNTSRKQSAIIEKDNKNTREKISISNSNSLKNEKKQISKQSFTTNISKLEKKEDQEFLDKEISKNHFIYHYVIGKGGFGKVWSVQMKKTKKIYAMKEMLKTKIIGKKSVNSVMNERLLLANLSHPFIVNMNYAFQDRQCLYLVMDLLTGGDLRYHIGRRRKFKENQTRFFIACIILGLQYLHQRNIIHRDIKPENLVMDEKGYLRITDLGIARLFKPNNNADTSGTPGYMAPEVMCRQDHSFAVDYYAVGVIVFQFMLGKRPYFGKNRKEIRDQILAKQAIVKQQQLPQGWSLSALDFVNKLIQRKPANRLGSNSISQIKDHPWFKGFSWNKLLKKQLQAPFIPKPIHQNFDYRQQISSTSQDQMESQNQLLLRKKSVQDLFSGYTFSYKQQNKTGKSSAINNNNNSTLQAKYIKNETKKNNFFQ